MSTAAIQFENVSKTYTGRKLQRVDALKDVSFSVMPGEIFGFLGPNGAGKSTSIKILLDLIRPTAGKTSIAGLPSGSVDARRNIGFLPENPSFYDTLSASELLDFTGRCFGMTSAAQRDRKECVLRQFDLWDARRRTIRTFSKGMVQKLGLAQALLHDPDVLILDEPMSGLDPLARVMVKNILLDEKKRGKTIFFSTHILSDVELLCDRVGILHKGVLRGVEQVSTLLKQGVVSYTVSYRDPIPGIETSIQVRPDALLPKLKELDSDGKQILLVEPVRQNLEAFFVQAVNQENSA